MDTNLRGAFFVAQQTAKRMIARAKGDPRKQHRIVNIASVAGLRVLPQIGVYCMSKAGVVQMTKAMAVEWGKYDINVNAICPGYIATDDRTKIISRPSRAASSSTCCHASAPAGPKTSTACCSCWPPKKPTSSTAPSSRPTTA